MDAANHQSNVSQKKPFRLRWWVLGILLFIITSLAVYFYVDSGQKVSWLKMSDVTISNPSGFLWTWKVRLEHLPLISSIVQNRRTNALQIIVIPHFLSEPFLNDNKMWGEAAATNADGTRLWILTPAQTVDYIHSLNENGAVSPWSGRPPTVINGKTSSFGAFQVGSNLTTSLSGNMYGNILFKTIKVSAAITLSKSTAWRLTTGVMPVTSKPLTAAFNTEVADHGSIIIDNGKPGQSNYAIMLNFWAAYADLKPVHP